MAHGISLKGIKSRELRAGILFTGCDCIKRNGLQDDCPRSQCQGSPACLTPEGPTCGPGLLALDRVKNAPIAILKRDINPFKPKCDDEKPDGTQQTAPTRTHQTGPSINQTKSADDVIVVLKDGKSDECSCCGKKLKAGEVGLCKDCKADVVQGKIDENNKNCKVFMCIPTKS